MINTLALNKTRFCSKCSRRILVKFWDQHSSYCDDPIQPLPALLAPLSPSPILSQPLPALLAPLSPSPVLSQPEVAATAYEAAPSPSNQLKSLPTFTVDDRLTQLNKFEVLLLTPSQISEFNKLYEEKKFDVLEPLFRSWLILKLASIPSEAEALRRVLTKHTSSNVPKRKNQRKENLPVGPVR